MSRKFAVRTSILALFAAGFFAYLTLDAGSHLTLESLRGRLDTLRAAFEAQPFATALAFASAYVAATALSLPGATIFTLAAGAVFGAAAGTAIASIASTIGATLAFLGSRYLFRDVLQAKFRSQLASINAGIARDGASYLLGLRLAPVFPFFVVNLVMGVTKMPALPFALVSQVGMLPGTVAYVYAGSRLADLRSPSDALSKEMLLALFFLAAVPLASKRLLEAWKTSRKMARHRRPKRFDYNIAVIGAGSAGLVAAYVGSAIKAKVALVEKGKMGGDCLNSGCVPSKALIRAAKAAAAVREASVFGVEAGAPQVDFSKVMAHVRGAISLVAPHDSVERYASLGVDCYAGEAKILSPYEIKVGNKVISARNLIVATGARPFIPAMPGLAEVRPLTTDSLWDLERLPKRLIILGGGPVGCELSQAFQRLGARTTLIERSARIMAREDADISEAIYAALKNEGVDIRVSCEAIRASSGKTGKRLIWRENGREFELEADEILLALGRKANVKGFGLEELGVEISSRGEIAADEFLRSTNVPNIYVCGDVAGPYQFTHVASHQAWYAAVNALFSPLKAFRVDYRVIPWCTFCDPEAARVGLSEDEAKEQGVAYEVARYDLADLDRAIVDGEAKGFVKVLTAPGRDRILGAAIVGHGAGELIAEYVFAMKHGIGLNKVLGTIHVYPTFAEANKYAAGVWKRQSAPAWALDWLARFHAWRR